MSETDEESERICGGPTKNGGRCQITPPEDQTHCYMHPNEFDCPECGVHHTGWPESCMSCGAAFSWESAGESYYND